MHQTPHPEIRLIASDLDGTLLNSHNEVSPRTERAIKAAMQRGVQFVIATGKSYHSVRHLIPRLGLTSPGVFVQGIVIHNADGSVHSSSNIDPHVVEITARYAEQADIATVLYSGDRMLCGAIHPDMEILTDHHEPLPEVVGSLVEAAHRFDVQKVWMYGTAEKMTEARGALEAQLSAIATLVQPQPQMLEVLPLGASKGSGVRRLLTELGVDPQHMMAIGDGENDVEMLRMAGIGVAVANAMPAAKDAADVVVASHDEDGVAEAIERFVLKTLN